MRREVARVVVSGKARRFGCLAMVMVVDEGFRRLWMMVGLIDSNLRSRLIEICS